MEQDSNKVADKARYETTTIAERGPVLPLGVFAGGSFHQNIGIRPWRLKEEKALGRKSQELGEKNIGSYVASVLAMMCTKLGNEDWSEWKEDDLAARELVVSQMFMPDVFYAYIWLRIQSVGHELRMTLRSPYTQKEFDFVGDLRTVEVKVPKSINDCLTAYKLLAPIEFRGQERERIILGPIRWYNVENFTNIGEASGAIIESAVYNIPSEEDEGPYDEMQITEGELDEQLTKRDITGLIEAINENGFGPQMVVKAVCPTTRKTFEAPINWRYDSFFGNSS